MSDESATPRIVDAVFARAPRVRRRGVVGALVAGTALHAGLVGWAVVSAPSLETWSAELATRVHAQLTREEAIELPKPPPPPEKPKVEPPTPPPQRPIARARRMVEPRNAPPPPPAEAGKILAADPSAPVDLTATTFVTGTASTYAGGITSTKGTNKHAVTGPVSTGPPQPPAPRPRTPPAEDLSAPVVLDETNWNCAWPHEAEAQQIDEQQVVIQVIVRADGSAESVKTLSDPGAGFAAAARACAMATRFEPARDREGRAVRAESPPIRVHFTR